MWGGRGRAKIALWSVVRWTAALGLAAHKRSHKRTKIAKRVAENPVPAAVGLSPLSKVYSGHIASVTKR
jgi:hypothetical protein